MRVVRGGFGDVVSVAGRGVARYLCQDLRAALLGPGQGLQHEGATAFSAHEAVTTLVPWAARALRVVVATAEREHRAEACNADRCDGRFRAARDHDLRVAALHHAQGLTDGVPA